MESCTRSRGDSRWNCGGREEDGRDGARPIDRFRASWWFGLRSSGRFFLEILGNLEPDLFNGIISFRNFIRMSITLIEDWESCWENSIRRGRSRIILIEWDEKSGFFVLRQKG